MGHEEGRRRILIVKLGSIGDVVHALPALNALREHLPAAHIAWLVEPSARELVANHPALDEVIVFDRDRTSLFRTLLVLCSLRKNLRRRPRFHTVLEMHGNLRAAFLGFLSGARERLGFRAGSSRVEFLSTLFTNRKISEGKRAHILERNLNFASALGANTQEVKFRVPIDPEAARDIGLLLASESVEDHDVVVLHPGAYWASKRWPEERWRELAVRIARSFPGTAIVVTQGPGEERLVSRIGMFPGGEVLSAGKTTLGQLIALLGRAQLVIASDTGPLHIAAAMGTRVIGLYGPTDPRRNGPYGEGHFVIQKDLDCRGCWRRRCTSDECMRDISVEEVMEKVALCFPPEKSKCNTASARAGL